MLQENFCLNSILNVMANPVACKDKNVQYLFVNRAFEKLVGFRAKEIIGYTRIEMYKIKWMHETYQKIPGKGDLILSDSLLLAVRILTFYHVHKRTYLVFGFLIVSAP
ncbi:PAS domain S-box protein [Methanosarcina sp.]|uniref:PAS domain S-box protein n=1 Tax=Methanosarcina sp. TaxID=2213 RepID=UPI002C72FB21|nr:PAS domain S-box protein [Methanosarcina sp.]HOW14398.1 PAS domain S-box protein [Methanosarcina sp.]